MKQQKRPRLSTVATHVCNPCQNATRLSPTKCALGNTNVLRRDLPKQRDNRGTRSNCFSGQIGRSLALSRRDGTKAISQTLVRFAGLESRALQPDAAHPGDLSPQRPKHGRLLDRVAVAMLRGTRDGVPLLCWSGLVTAARGLTIGARSG
ncbi:hypothetical protein VTN96DRAFT_5145 [Rasamsonia emersonii]